MIKKTPGKKKRLRLAEEQIRIERAIVDITNSINKLGGCQQKRYDLLDSLTTAANLLEKQSWKKKKCLDPLDRSIRQISRGEINNKNVLVSLEIATQLLDRYHQDLEQKIKESFKEENRKGQLLFFADYLS